MAKKSRSKSRRTVKASRTSRSSTKTTRPVRISVPMDNEVTSPHYTTALYGIIGIVIAVLLLYFAYRYLL